jgi:hypothetical protein
MSYHSTKITKFLNIQAESLDDGIKTLVKTLDLDPFFSRIFFVTINEISESNFL